MPTYEYRCKECGQGLEVVQSFTDDPLTTCEACGGPLRKVFGSVGISFKGSGFYKTDTRGKSAAASDGATPGKGDTGDKAGKGTDSSTSSGSSNSSSGTSSDKASSPKPADAAKTA